MFTRRYSIKLMASALLAAPSIARSASQDYPALHLRVVHSPPRCLRMPNGRWSGFEVDMTTALCEAVGIQLEAAKDYLAWPRALKAMRRGDLINLMTAVSFREERALFLDYLCPFDYEQIMIIVHKENAHIDFSSMEDFMVSDLPIERVGSTVLYPPFDKRYDEDPEFASHFIEISESSSGTHKEHRIALAKRIQRGRIFGNITDWYIANELAQLSHEELGFPPDDLVAIPLKLFGSPPTYLTASRALPQPLRDQLRVASAQAHESGLMEEIWVKWYGARPMPPRS